MNEEKGNILSKFKSNKSIYLLILILVASFGIRFRDFSASRPPGWDIYFHGRMAEEIHETNRVPRYDQMAYGGRRNTYPPLYHVFLSIAPSIGISAVLFGQIITPLIFIAGLILLYLVIKETHDDKTALLSTFLFSFSWGVLKFTSVDAQPTAIIMALFIAMLYLIQKNKILYILPLAVMLPFIHLSSFIIGLFILMKSLFVSKNRKWIFLIGSLIIALSVIVAYPHFSQDIPPTLARQIHGLNWSLIIKLSPIALILAIGGIYRKKLNSFWGSIFIVSLALIALELIETSRGLLFLSLGISVISASYLISNWGLKDIFHSHEIILSSKKIKTGVIVSWVILISMISFQVIYPLTFSPLGHHLVLTEEKDEALQWINQNTLKNSVIMSGPDHWVTGRANRPTYMDGYFRGQKDVAQRYEYVEAVYNSNEEKFFEAISQVDYVLIFKDTLFFSVDTSMHEEHLLREFENSETVIYKVPEEVRNKSLEK
ncbi:MAG: hypothetical protein ACOCTT_00370 [archaeon]